MTDLTLRLPDDLATRLCAPAERIGLSADEYVTRVLRERLTDDWPPDYFQEVVGGWKGEPFERPAQQGSEDR